MKIISHRGNLNGRIPDKENHPLFIQEAIDANYEVEIDVWYFGEKFFLGHDYPIFPVEPIWFLKKPLWCHAKNTEAFEKMLELGIHCFWHENDKMTLTSRGLLWMYPGNYSHLGVTVCLNKPEEKIPNMWGVCTDYPNDWKQK